MAVVLEVYLVAVYAMLARLRVVEGHHAEQTAIGTLAKMGNGLLLTVLGLLVLEARQAPLPDQLVFCVSTAAVYGLSFFVLVSQPERAAIGYRG